MRRYKNQLDDSCAKNRQRHDASASTTDPVHTRSRKKNAADSSAWLFVRHE